MLLWTLGAFMACAPLGAEVIDRVMAVASGHLILLSDVRAAQTFQLVVLAPDDGVPVVVSRLIDRALILDEVNRYAPPEPEARDVEAELALVRARFAAPADYSAALARIGMSEDELREIVRQNLRVRTYITQRFSADTPEQAAVAIGEWLAGLRRRGAVVDFSATR